MDEVSKYFHYQRPLLVLSNQFSLDPYTANNVSDLEGGNSLMIGVESAYGYGRLVDDVGITRTFRYYATLTRFTIAVWIYCKNSDAKLVEIGHDEVTPQKIELQYNNNKLK